MTHTCPTGGRVEPGRSGATASHDDCGSITEMRDQRPSLNGRWGQNVTGHCKETRGGNVSRCRLLLPSSLKGIQSVLAMLEGNTCLRATQWTRPLPHKHLPPSPQTNRPADLPSECSEADPKVLTRRLCSSRVSNVCLCYATGC